MTVNVTHAWIFFKRDLEKGKGAEFYVAGLESIPTPQAIGKPQ